MAAPSLVSIFLNACSKGICIVLLPSRNITTKRVDENISLKPQKRGGISLKASKKRGHFLLANISNISSSN